MARKTSLREFQQNVAQRLRDLSSRKTVASKLGFQVGADHWLVTLADVSEVIPVPNFVRVPRTMAWFRGVSNIRGKLYSVVDFSAFQGADAIGPGMERRVILINERLIEGSALLVTRMLGLRNPETLTTEPSVADAPPWEGGRFRDPAGTVWRELDVAKLAIEPRFLEVGNETAAPALL
ncbi:MAG: chemotaxis protein CheW [Betaproteobacteria bacterium]|nr:chemotaxis protein CheW [Betaproteobacteria bacterium]